MSSFSYFSYSSVYVHDCFTRNNPCVWLWTDCYLESNFINSFLTYLDLYVVFVWNFYRVYIHECFRRSHLFMCLCTNDFVVIRSCMYWFLTCLYLHVFPCHLNYLQWLYVWQFYQSGSLCILIDCKCSYIQIIDLFILDLLIGDCTFYWNSEVSKLFFSVFHYFFTFL